MFQASEDQAHPLVRLSALGHYEPHLVWPRGVGGSTNEGGLPRSRSSKRPRFALCVWLALIELAKGGCEWRGSRGRLAEVASALLPPDRFAERHAARIARMLAAKNENPAVRAETPEAFDTVVDQGERDRVTRWRHPLQTLAIEHAAGNPDRRECEPDAH